MPLEETIHLLADKAFLIDLFNEMHHSYKLQKQSRAKVLPCVPRSPADDTLVIMPDKTLANVSFETLNQTHLSVKFTMEVENNAMLPFLV